MDDVSLPISKLGHELEDIRVGALTTLLSKLDLGIISVKDLVKTKDIFVNLINWFKFPTVPCKEDVLNLILALVKDKDGAFCLEVADPGLKELTDCVGNEFRNELIEIKRCVKEMNDASIDSKEVTESFGSFNSLTGKEETTPSSVVSLYSSSSTRNSSASFWDYQEIFWCVPLLDESDKRVLASVGNLLNDTSQSIQAANFFSTVLLHDFPPQVFLHDTTILNALFELYTQTNGETPSIIKCFQEFTNSLHRQFKFYADPSAQHYQYAPSRDVSEETLALYEWKNLNIQDIESPRQQLGVGEFCGICLEKLSNAVPGILKLLQLCMNDITRFWASTSGLGLKASISNHLASLTVRLKAARLSETVGRVEVQTWASEVLSKLVPIEAASTIVNRNLQLVLVQELFDHNLLLMYPRVHAVFRAYVSSFMYQEDDDYSTVEEIIGSVRAAVKFMRCFHELSVYEALSQFKMGILSLDIHKEYPLVKLFFEIILEKQLAVSETELAEEIILSLLSHAEVAVSAITYSQLSLAVSKVLGPSSVKQANRNPLDRIPFILNCRVLHEVICFGVTNELAEIRRDAETILTLLLKSKMVVHIDYWPLILAVINSCLPLLVSFASESNALGKAVLLMTDPDIAPQLCLHKLQILNGNIRLLFSQVADVVQEGYTRLVYLLNVTPIHPFSMPDPSLTLPRPPLGSNYFDEDSVARLANLLDTLGFSDWKMLRSAVVQLGHISEEPSLHISILETEILFHLKEILREAVDRLDDDSKELYSSIILILKNLAIFNIQLRHDFSIDYELICDVVKGLFMFPPERRMLRDAVQLLSLIAFSDFILSTSNGVISLPKVIVDFMILPFPVNTHLLISEHIVLSKKSFLMDRRDACRLIGSVWCCEMAGGAHIFISDTTKPQKPITLPPPLELPPLKTFFSLRLELQLMLTDLRVANSHQDALKAVHSISRYLRLLRWSDDKFEDLDWEQSFKRYLMTLPASPSDQKLLISILQVLTQLIEIVKSQSVWISKVIKDPTNMLYTILAQSTVEETTVLRKEMSMELLVLVEKCLRYSPRDDWESLAMILLQSLNHSHSQKFYSLAVIDRLLSVLITTAEQNDGPLKVSQIPLWKLLAAFHCPSQTSFMGLTITRRLLFVLNVINCSFKDTVLPEEVSWLGKLLDVRDPLLVGAALELCSRLGGQNAAMATLLSSLPDLWNVVLRILLNDGQATLVREHAAVLCCNIVGSTQNKNYVTDAVSGDIFKSFNLLYLKYQAANRADDKSICLYRSKRDDSGRENGQERRGYISPALISSICSLTVNLMSKDSSKIISAALSSSFIQNLASDICSWQCEKLGNQEIIKMYESVLRLLVYACGDSKTSINILDSIPTLIWLLLPSSYAEGLKNEGIVTESLRLIAIVLSRGDPQKMTTEPQIPGEGVSMLCAAACSQDPGLASAAAAAITVLAPYLTQIACKELVLAMGNRDSMRAALASVVANSHSATIAAVEAGLLEEIVYRLRGIQLRLSLVPRNSKKASLAMEELCIELGLITNFLAGSELAKEQCVTLGLADTLHKMWVWCLTDYSLLSVLLRTLITFTSDSIIAAGSLVLTSTLAGVGQRKTPTSSSLLHALLVLIQNDVYPYGIKLLLLQLLSHACQTNECRSVITKSGFLSEFLSTYSQKKSATVDEAESGWLKFLLILSSYNDGQLALIKNDEVLQKIIDYMSGCRGSRHRPTALSIVRNLVFNQANRQRFILSDKILKSIGDRLSDKDGLNRGEVEDVLLIGWALAANSQRGKGCLRAMGLLPKLEAAIQLYHPALMETEMAQVAFQRCWKIID
ncbi:rotatin [Halyomorpha halys]|uniref:rotatin n=1 Tax=Halyomorpha halys TaxID=286706 RepID=UPI0006D5111D